MTGARLRGADLTDARLTSVRLRGADLTDARLGCADLTDANLTEVLWSGRTLWPEGMASLIQNRSEELRPGLWRVVGAGGSVDVETEDPLVPVI